MPSYRVEISPSLPGMTLKNGHNVMIVEANSSADAKQLVLGHHTGPGEGGWADATVTEITVGTDLSPVTNPDDGEVLEYVLTVIVTGGTVSETFVHTAVAADTYADCFDAMVVLLNANATIANAAFAANLLTVSSIADGIGDHAVTASFTYGGEAIASFLGAIVDEGIAGAVLTIATSTGVVAPTIVAYGA